MTLSRLGKVNALCGSLTLLALSVIAARLWHQRNVPEPADPLKFDMASLNVADVLANSRVPVDLVLWNRGRTSARLVGVETSCSCAVGQILQDTLAPGAQMKVPVQLKAADQLGLKQVVLALHGESGQKKQVATASFSYWVTNEAGLVTEPLILPAMELEPSRSAFIEFTLVGRPQVTASLNVLNLPEGAELRISPSQSHRIDGMTQRKVSLRMSYEQALELAHKPVRLATSAGSVDVPVGTKMVGEATPVPNAVFLGMMKPGEKVTQTVRIDASSPIRVDGGELAQASLVSVPGEVPHYLVEATYLAPARAGLVQRDLRVLREVDGVELARVAISALILP